MRRRQVQNKNQPGGTISFLAILMFAIAMKKLIQKMFNIQTRLVGIKKKEQREYVKKTIEVMMFAAMYRRVAYTGWIIMKIKA